MRRLLLLVCLPFWAWGDASTAPAPAPSPRVACLGSLPVGSFRLSLRPAAGGTPLPVRTVNTIRAGQKLEYKPIHLPADTKDKAQISVVLLPTARKDTDELVVLDPEKASEPAEWTVPRDTSVVALVFGPQGLSVKKLKSLVDKNQEILSELADYADQNSKVEALVQALETSEQSGRPMDAALAGFSSTYSVAVPKLDTHATTDQQAAVLLRALMPTATTYDPLASRTAVMQQSAGLAASVAGMFFGSPVGLAAGGAVLAQNLRTMMFPGMEFRSAFAQASTDGLALCAGKQPPVKRTRLAYLWAHRVPGLEKPSVSLAGDVHVPATAKSFLRLDAPNPKGLDRAREWHLTSQDGKTRVPVAVTLAAVPPGVNAQPPSPALELDLTKARPARGEYTLAASWDWDALPVPGKVFVHAFGDLKKAQVAPRSRDRLAEGNGRVAVTLTGPDFEFVEKASLERADNRHGAPVELPFTLPKGKRAGEQTTMEVEVDTSSTARGDYRFLLVQGDGLTYEVPFTVLPPNPKIANSPLRANIGEDRQTLTLRGSGLERIQAISTEAGTLDLAESGAPAARDAVFRLGPQARQGDRFALRLKVQGIEEPLELPGALEIIGRRPRIAAVRKSLPQENSVVLRPEEVPAGAAVSFALSVVNLDATPTVEVGCSGEHDVRQKVVLSPGDRTGGVRLDLAGEGMLFLSLDPGVVGQPGCRLTALVATQSSGRSDPYQLGQVVRVPRIDQFSLTDEKLGDGVYAGILKGQDLDTIERTGWDAEHGTPVQSIPTAAPGEPQRQLLKVAMPWPAPAPHAPVFVWLRGESQGRATGARY